MSTRTAWDWCIRAILRLLYANVWDCGWPPTTALVSQFAGMPDPAPTERVTLW